MSDTFQKNCPMCSDIMIYSTKRKLKQALCNNSMCEKCRRKTISKGRKGKSLSEEHKNKIKLSMLHRSKESKQIYIEISKKMKGRTFSAEHRKNLSLSLMGDKNPAKKKEVREKIRDTFVNNYLNLEPHNVFSKSCIRYRFSGTTLHYQGSYELDFLQNFYGKINIENGLAFKYVDKDDNQRIYFSDFYLPDFNLIVEIKSTYTLLKCKGSINNDLKERSVLESGYNFLFVLDKDYEKFKNIINIEK